MTHDIIHALTDLGLSQKEAEFYVRALPMEPCSILSLSLKTKMNRITVTSAIERLTAMGLFISIKSEGKTLYAAAQPTKLVQLAKEREERVKAILPDLSAIAGLGTIKPKVLYFEGREQVRALAWSTLVGKQKELLSYSPSKYSAELFGQDELEALVSERISKKIFSRVLRNHGADLDYRNSEESTSNLREVRYLPSHHAPKMSFELGDTFICFFSPIEECYGLRIESASFVALQRYFFELLWEQAVHE